MKIAERIVSALLDSFEEVTYIEPSSMDEVMVHEEAGTGRILDVYVYRDSPLLRDEEYNFGWKQGKNPLFFHAQTRNLDQLVAHLEGLGYERPDRELAAMDDRADQEKAKGAARRFLKPKPKAYMVGDTLTMYGSVGGN